MNPVNSCRKEAWDIRLGVLHRCRASAQTLEIPDEVHTIAEGAFSLVKAETVRVPDHVKICPGAFRKSRIQKVILPENLKRIEDYTFCGCESLRHVKLPESLTYIGRFAFAGCKSLTEWEPPQLFDMIDEGAFSESGLKTLRIRCRLIARKAFWHCEALEKAWLDDVMIIEDKAFARCGALQEAVLKEPLLRIGEGAFRDCEQLCKVTLPKSLQECGFKSFSGIRATDIAAPKHLQALLEDENMTGKADEDEPEAFFLEKDRTVFDDPAMIHYTE